MTPRSSANTTSKKLIRTNCPEIQSYRCRCRRTKKNCSISVSESVDLSTIVDHNEIENQLCLPAWARLRFYSELTSKMVRNRFIFSLHVRTFGNLFYPISAPRHVHVQCASETNFVSVFLWMRQTKESKRIHQSNGECRIGRKENVHTEWIHRSHGAATDPSRPTENDCARSCLIVGPSASIYGTQIAPFRVRERACIMKKFSSEKKGKAEFINSIVPCAIGAAREATQRTHFLQFHFRTMMATGGFAFRFIFATFIFHLICAEPPLRLIHYQHF